MKIGKIYKIIVGQSNECYVGSTFDQLTHRFKGHKNDYKNKDNPRASRLSSFNLFEKYGVENCKIVLIKQYEVLDRRHLEVYETLWIKKLKAINKNEPFGNGIKMLKNQRKKQWSQANKEYYEQYREQNNEMIKEKKKQWREENKDKIKEGDKKYREQNKEKINKKQKEKVKCECGAEVTKKHLTRHKEETKKHQKFIESQ